MSQLSTRSVIHRRFSAFVDWIAPEDSMEEAIRKQAEEIRDRIKAKAAEYGMVVRSTPNCGSFAKRTGLRRHLLGDSVVEGQDVDLTFVISPQTRDHKSITELLRHFYNYAHSTYPQTSKKFTKSSVNLNFVGSKLSYDLVPMLATEDPETQVIIRQDGEQRQTSVQKHIEFIRKRTRSSNEVEGRVKFNECVRLFKWWRDFRQERSHILPEVPTIVIDLLCAKAYDQKSVKMTYAETLLDWSLWLSYAISTRQSIWFNDYYSSLPYCRKSVGAWEILDPVNAENNVVANWNASQREELARWFSEASRMLNLAIDYDCYEEDDSSLSSLADLFGKPFKNHCEG